MKQFRTLLILALSGLSLQCAAQSLPENRESVITALLERLIENTEADLDFTDLREQLEFYARNRLNLNKASREQLQRLFFLNERQISAILNHREKFGDFLALYELQSIEALDEQTIYYLAYFVTLDENWQQDQTPFGTMLRLGKHELIGLYDTELQQRVGYSPERKASGQNFYSGSPVRQVVRYRFSYGGRLQFGYTGEKDMGEQFAAGAQRYGFDFNGMHFYYRPRKGIIRAIAVGDYQADFGQGLTFATGMAARKSAYVLNVSRNFTLLRPYRSLNENEFLRGASVLLQKRGWQLMAFASGKSISAAPGTDSLTNQPYFGSISLSGLHRTASEAARRKMVFQQVYGLHVKKMFKYAHLGVTHVETMYNASFLPGNQLYQRYAFSGKTLGNTGVDYGLQWQNTRLFGEFSMSSNGGFACLSGITASLDVNLDMVLLYRNYGRNYQVISGNAFGENTDLRNEQGIYSGLALRLSRKWLLNAYVDLYRSAWLRYLTDGPSNGTDVLGELQYTPSRNTLLYFRWRQEIKQRNQADNESRTDYLSTQSRSIYRFHAQYKASLRVTARNRVEVVLFKDDHPQKPAGVLLFQDLSWGTEKRLFTCSVRLAYFTIDDYNARVYASENDVLYQYAVPLYQNSGTRYYAVVRYNLTRKTELWLKFSETIYSNVQTIGSGLEQMNGNRISDVRVQVRLIL